MKETLLESLGGTHEEDLPSTFTSEQKPNKPKDAEEVVEIGASTEEIRNVAKNSLDFLSALCMPLVHVFNFPPVFLAVWKWLLSYVHTLRTFPQLALGLPRGFGKTTLVKIFVIYCILFTNRRFILIISATRSLAENILSDVIDILEEPNIKRVFGDWKLGVEKDTQGLKKFGFRGRNITLAAIGAESSLRGLNIKNSRPDIMIFEDIQSRECADSEVQSTSLENWMVGTAMKAKSPTGCMFLFIANMYPTKFSILRKLKNNPTWVKFITGGIQADGTSLWEELQPIEQLMTEFQNDLAMGKPEIFYAEVLNDENVSANTLIDLSKLPEFTYQEGDIPAGKFIVIDPSNDKINSDAVSIGYFEVHDTYPCLMKLEEGRFSPGETIRKALALGLENNCNFIVVEGNAYQYSLLYWFDFICKQVQIEGFILAPIYSGKNSKNARILDMFKAYAAGEMFVHPECRLAVHSQITDFNPLKRDNTDGLLDLLTYAPRVVAEFQEELMATITLYTQEYELEEIEEFVPPF